MRGILLAPLVLIMGACTDTPDRNPIAADPARAATVAGQAATPAPRLVSRTPEYPAVAVYIVYREYVNSHPGLTHLNQDDPKYQHYVEKRLRELYPQRGYAGMMREAVAEMRDYRRQLNEHEHARKAPGGISVQNCEINMTSISIAEYCAPGGGGGGGGGGGTYLPPQPEYYDDGSWSGQSEFVVNETQVPTIAQEVDSLQASAYEHDRLQYYESLALGNGGGYQIQGDGTLTRDDLIRMAATGAGPGEVNTQLWQATITIPLGVAAFFVPRILFSKWRAESASESYYPTLNPGDTKRDAFRHIYVNVMLRRYTTAPIAKAVMDVNEWGNANWGARIMDVHNNRLGVEIKYEYFRGHWFWDRWSYGVWGGRVRNYVNDSRNAAHLPTLEITYDEATAKSIRAQVPAHIYIYIR